jgi:hypothetical protein
MNMKWRMAKWIYFLSEDVPRDRLINIEISNDYDFMTDSKSFFTFAKILYEKEKRSKMVLVACNLKLDTIVSLWIFN